MKRGLVVGKRGLSTLVTSLILILLVLVAVGILYSVYINFIKEGVGDISMGKFTINLEVQSVVVNDDSIDVNVKRNMGDGALTGIKFVVSDGVKTEVFDESTTIDELGSNTFNLAYSGLVKDVSVAPIVTTSSGKESVGNVADKFEIPEKRILENLGAVSWWKFEGNANDEIGGNDGTLFGDTVCNVEGKKGNACSFDGSGDYVNVGSVPIGSNWAISAWFNYPLASPSTWNTLIRGISYHHIIVQRSNMHLGVYLSGFRDSGFGMSTLSNGWHHLTAVGTGGNTLFYIDGEYKGTSAYQPTDNIMVIGNYQGGSQQFGTIDEPMIFNKALTEDEVKALYNLY